LKDIFDASFSADDMKKERDDSINEFNYDDSPRFIGCSIASFG
jgi:hypothetical protein